MTIEARPGVPGAGLMRLRRRGRTARPYIRVSVLLCRRSAPQPVADSYLGRYGLTEDCRRSNWLVEGALSEEPPKHLGFQPQRVCAAAETIEPTHPFCGGAAVSGGAISGAVCARTLTLILAAGLTAAPFLPAGAATKKCRYRTSSTAPGPSWPPLPRDPARPARATRYRSRTATPRSRRGGRHRWRCLGRLDCAGHDHPGLEQGADRRQSDREGQRQRHLAHVWWLGRVSGS